MAAPEAGSATETRVLLELEALLYRTSEDLSMCDSIGRASQSCIVFIVYSAGSATSLSVHPVYQFASFVRLVVHCDCRCSKTTWTICQSREHIPESSCGWCA